MLPYKYLKNHYWTADIIILACLFLILYAWGAGSYPLFAPDEGRYSEVAREMITSGDYITPKVNGIVFFDKPILFYWLQALAIKIFGLKEWSIRFFPILAGIVTCLFTYIIARILYDRKTAFLASIILALSPLFFGCAHYANLDLEIAAWISSTLFAFIAASYSAPPLRNFLFLLMYICSAFAFLTKGLIGVVLPSAIIFIWLIIQKKLTTLREIYLIPGICLWLLIVLPWFIAVQIRNPMFLDYFFLNQQVQRFLSADIFNNQHSAWFYLSVILVGFFPWSIFLIQALIHAITKIFRNRLAIELFFLIWIIFILLFFTLPQSKIVSYILPVFPPCAILTASYITHHWRINTGVVDNSTILGVLSRFFASHSSPTSMYDAALQSSKTNVKHLSPTHCKQPLPFPQVNGAKINLFWMGVLLATILYLLRAYVNSGFIPYLYVLIAMHLIMASAGLLLFFVRSTIAPLFIICCSLTVIILVTLVNGAFYLNQNTARPLAALLREITNSQDEIVSYFKYYQDLPFYLERQISIVNDWDSKKILSKDNWARELFYGQQWYPNKLIINEEQFWHRWHNKKRIFVLLNKNYFNQFKKNTVIYFELKRYNNTILLTNQKLN